jgi:hypothetical protein
MTEPVAILTVGDLKSELSRWSDETPVTFRSPLKEQEFSVNAGRKLTFVGAVLTPSSSLISLRGVFGPRADRRRGPAPKHTWPINTPAICGSRLSMLLRHPVVAL